MEPSAEIAGFLESQAGLEAPLEVLGEGLVRGEDGKEDCGLQGWADCRC